MIPRVGKALERLRATIDANGTAAMEAAIAAPVVLILMVGAIEYGNLLYNANLIQTGLRDAARYLARVDDPMQREQEAKRLAVTGTISGSAPARVAWWQEGHITISRRSLTNTSDAEGRRPLRGGDEVYVVRVATEVDYRGFGTLSALGRDALRLAFAHEERVVGQ